MSIGVYGILIIFGAFILILIFNPNLSCFGKRIKSPFYPLLRKRARQRKKAIPTEDYGFNLGGGGKASRRSATREISNPVKPPGKPLVPEDYGFSLRDDGSGDKAIKSAENKNISDQEDS